MNKKTDSNLKNQRIQVFARCRPLNSIEKKQHSPSIVEVVPEKKIVVKDRNASKEFLFDKVFPPDTKQISVYKAVVEPLIQEVLMGYNCTVFAYGQTGTGKTYTMEGERNNSTCSWEEDPEAGIIPRSLHQLFEDLNKEENVEFSVRVSFVELYNEELFDLLNPTELSKLTIYKDNSKNGSVIIQGLEEILVNNKDEVYSILERGTAKRQTAATLLNATSSRSHTVFSVTVHIKENTVEGEELLKTGKLNLVDLAGSENVGRSGAIDKRAREAGNINQSLLTLGRVITALIEKTPHVPYRESKLTRLLQDSLGGHTKTSIIATISPAQCNFDETISTLDYATKAKSITIKPEINQKMTKRALIREYTEEIERLRKDLMALRSKEGFYIHMDSYQGFLNDIAAKEAFIKDLTEKNEELKEENSKIEGILNVTKEELDVTCEKLTETSQKYVETASKLSAATDALFRTRKVLTETTVEKEEKQHLIKVQCNTEKKLTEQAKELLNVAKETTSDVDKLHSKLDRKVMIEKTNEEHCHEFRKNYQEQFLMLDEFVSSSEKQQAANLLKTKEDIDYVFHALHSHHAEAMNFFSKFTGEMMSSMQKISNNFASETDSQIEWTNSLISKLSSKKENLSRKQFSFMLERLPEFANEMNMKNSAIQEWICNIHRQLSEKIESEKDVLCKRSEERKELQNAMKESLDSLCKSYEEILKDFQMQSSEIRIVENELEKDFEEKLNALKTNILFFEEFAGRQKELRRNISKRDDFIVSGIKQNAVKYEEVHKPLLKLYNSESAVEEDKTALNQMLNVVNINEFSTKQDSLSQSQLKVITEFEKFTKENIEEEESILVGAESSLKSHLLTLSQNVQLFNKSISEINSSLEDCAQSEKASAKKNVEEIEKIIHKTKDKINESEEVLSSNAKKIRDEFMKMDNEIEKFISYDLLKDIPTGTTPQRKTYTYPKLLAATSPHDRILQRFRSNLTADAVNLPLNSSFSELEESPVSLSKSAVTDENNIFSNDDSDGFDTDSCASSVSDASIDSGKNKENQKNSKKRSRLPKKVVNKGFVKPALPVSRKPLAVANSEDPE